MKTKILNLVLVLSLILIMWGCNEDDGYSLNKYWISIATVENPENNSAFIFELDNGTRMWTTASNFMNFRPVDGQRIIANYTILSDKAEGSSYDHDVKLNDFYKVLTKGIFNITHETEDSIGNDPIRIDDMWIGSNYLNVEFVYPGSNRIHYINLVHDSTEISADEKVHLEFRHNANNDYPAYNRWGVVSFDLRSLQSNAVADSVNLVIYTNEYNASEEKTYEFTYKFDEVQLAPVGRKSILIESEKATIE